MVTPIKQIQKDKTVYFSTSAQVVRRWGRESIADPIIAIIELIKNCYDADATSCNLTFENVRIKEKGKIILKDNGVGMSEDDILKKWLRAATNNKSLSRFTKNLKRRKIGEKGIGRFATERLAKKITIISMPEKSEEGYILTINWADYDDPDADFEKVPLSLKYFDKDKEDHGLEIILEDLDDSWDEEQLNAVGREVSLIIPPRMKKGKFEVKLTAPEFPKFDGKIKSSFLNEADFKLNAKLDKNGKISYTITKRGRVSIKREDKMGKFFCGPIEFQLFFFYLGPTDYLSKKDKDSIDFNFRRKVMGEISGIKLYRDGFRVKPFGDRGNDWLDLDKERINNPALFPGNKQMFGVVKIGKDENPLIEDTTSRENIIKNLAWGDLTRFVKGALTCFMVERQKLEKKYKSKSNGVSKKKDCNTIKKAFKKTKKKPGEDDEKEELLIPLIPQDIIDNSPKNIAVLLQEFNKCLVYECFNGAAILARKILEISTILKFKRIGRGKEIISNNEYINLNQRVALLKKDKIIDTPLAKRLTEDNKIKIFGDTAAHSFMVMIKKEDVGPIRDLLRLCTEQLNFDS